MLQDQQIAFNGAQFEIEKNFDDSLNKMKDIMTMQDMEDERTFKRTQRASQEASDVWELELFQVFTRQEVAREQQFLEAEKSRETEGAEFLDNVAGAS